MFAQTPLPQVSPHEKLAYQINEAVQVSGLGRTTLYELIKSGKIRTMKAAGRRLILRSDLEAFLVACRDAV
jgi:excisionase family DNA binding protein